jgi:hypothetical protein
MNGLKYALIRDLKQILRALLLTYIILASTGFLFGQYIGFQEALLVCLVIALLVTITFMSLFICNVLWIAMENKTETNKHHSGKY